MSKMKKTMKMEIVQNLTLESGCELWLSNCKRRGLTQNILNYYHTVMNIFMDIINYKTLLSEIKKNTIDDFVFKLIEKEVKMTSVNTYLRGVRAIVYWWIEEKYVEPFKIQKIKVDEEIKDTFTNEEIKILLKKPNIKKCSFLEYESWVLCSTFYGLGSRASTIANLKAEDLDLDNNLIFYRKVKDRKQTIIPLGDNLVSIFREFLLFRKASIGDYVFVNFYGDKLIVDRINEILNRYYKSRGVTKTGVHIWRGTFAKNYIILGGNAIRLQAILCHKTLDMTRKFVNLYGNDIRDDDHNPLEQIIRSKQHMNMNKENI